MEKIDESLIVKVEEEETKEDEIFGLSWQSVGAIMMALQNSMMAAALGEEANLEDILQDFQLQERVGGEDPGLIVLNPPKVRALTPEQLAMLQEQYSDEEEE